jgi:hypothetical protein
LDYGGFPPIVLFKGGNVLAKLLLSKEEKRYFRKEYEKFLQILYVGLDKNIDVVPKDKEEP